MKSFLLVLLAFLSFNVVARAQQTGNALGVTIDLVAGGDNSPSALGGDVANKRLSLFYGGFPSFALSTSNSRSAFNLSYTFGFNRTERESNHDAQSHRASLNYSRLLSPKTRITFAESFEWTADAATFNGLRGVAPEVQNFNFIFYPVAVQQVARTGNSSIAIDYSINDKSSVSTSGAFNIRNYGSTAPFGSSLLNQQGGTGTFAYRRRTTQRDTWSFSYAGSYFVFNGFDNTSSNTVTLAYSNQISTHWNLQMSVGLSEARNLRLGSNYVGYDSSVGIQRTIKKTNSLSLNYSQVTGQPTGLGAISDYRRIALNASHTGRHLALFADASAFDSQGTLGNVFNSRGTSAAGNIGFIFSRYVSLQLGGQFQKYQQRAPFGFSQKRLFLSLRFNNPKLMRW